MDGGYSHIWQESPVRGAPAHTHRQGVDVAQCTTVLVWCETFAEFISAAKYR